MVYEYEVIEGLFELSTWEEDVRMNISVVDLLDSWADGMYHFNSQSGERCLWSTASSRRLGSVQIAYRRYDNGAFPIDRQGQQPDSIASPKKSLIVQLQPQPRIAERMRDRSKGRGCLRRWARYVLLICR